MNRLPQKTLADIQSLINAAETVLVTSHRDGDGDSVGAMLAVREYVSSLDKNAVGMQHGPVPNYLTFLPGSESIVDVTSNHSTIPELKFDLTIALECPNLDRCGDVIKSIDDGAPIINIDHHTDNTDYGAVNWVDASASSVGEMVTHLFSHLNYVIDRDNAERLYTAILTDTGRFHYPSASSDTFREVAKLVATGIDIQQICDRIYFSRRPQSIKLTGLALSQVDYSADERVCVIPISRDMMQAAQASNGDTEGIVEYTLYGEKAELGALLRDNDNGGVKVSLRSRGAWNVAQVAAEFGGGGHVNAAGCLIDSTLEAATELIKSRLIKTLGN